MKILFLTPYVPSSRKAAGENFTRLALEDLSEEHKISLVYFRYKNDPFYEVNSPNIKVFKVYKNSLMIKLLNCLKIPFLFPIFTIRFSFKLLLLLKKEHEKEKFDLIFLDHSQMFLYGKFFPDVKKVLLSHDVMYQRYSRKFNIAIALFVKLSEKYAIGQKNATLLSFSNKDKDILKEKYNVESKVINFYLGEKIVNTFPKNINDYFVFFGTWQRPENLDGLKWFFNEVFPLLKAHCEFKVIGGGLPKDFEENLISKNVECLGFLDNPYDYIANAKSLIAPLFTGAGVKVKVIEALACGAPVIGNDIAFEGISDEFSKFMLMANNKENFANLICSLSFSIQERIEFKKNFIYKYGRDTVGEVVNI